MADYKVGDRVTYVRGAESMLVGQSGNIESFTDEDNEDGIVTAMVKFDIGTSFPCWVLNLERTPLVPVRTLCPSCGALSLKDDTRNLTIHYNGVERMIQQHGLWCGECGEALLEPDDSIALEKEQLFLKAFVEDSLKEESK